MNQAKEIPGHNPGRNTFHKSATHELYQYCNNTQKFKEAMQAAGISSDDPVIPDGELQRFTGTGDKPGSKSGWYVYYAGPPAAGAFGCWKRGINETWCSHRREQLSPADSARNQRIVETAKRQREAETRQRHEKTSETVTALWNCAGEVKPDHPYLVKKQVHAHSIKQISRDLIIPIRDMAGRLWSIETIKPNGTKRFHTGGKLAGNFHLIGQPGDIVYLAEGYSTAASIFEATGQAVFISFCANNLLPVARTVWRNMPLSEIIIAADDDYQPGKPNPGIEAANKAALAIDGKVAIPKHPDGIRRKCDFNDLATEYGLDYVREVLA